jgi:hypothetical protein
MASPPSVRRRVTGPLVPLPPPRLSLRSLLLCWLMVEHPRLHRAYVTARVIVKVALGRGPRRS